MFSSIVRYWRMFGTGLSFVAVGLGGVFIFPVLNIVIRSRQRRTVIARACNQVYFPLYRWPDACDGRVPV